jgi:putative transposase
MVAPYAGTASIQPDVGTGHPHTGTNAIEALNAKLRRAVKIRGHFPNDEAATKLIYLVLRQTAAEWKMSPREWGEAKTQFAIMFEDRFVLA